MKNFKKLLGLFLAMVLIVSTADVFAAQAADKPKMNVSSRTIFVGGSTVRPGYANGYYVLKVKNRPAKYSIEWSSSNESVATVVKDKYKGTVTAVAPGTATITAKVIDKTTNPNTLYTLTTKITVKKNCNQLTVSPSTVDTLTVGDTVSLSGTMYDKSGKALTAGVDVTDTLKWESSDYGVAYVSGNGLVTATGKGTATITCYSVQTTSGTYSKLAKATARATVTINVKEKDVPAMTSVKQSALNKFVISFGSDYSSQVKLENIKLSRNNVAVDISSVEFSESGVSATVTTKSELISGSTYDVEITGTKATTGLTSSFKASAGEPVSMTLYTAIEGNKVVANNFSEILFKVYDANGVDVTPLSTNSATYLTYAARITCKAADTTTGNYFVNQRNVLIYDTNKTVTVVGTYNDSKGNTFTAVVDVTSVSEASTMTLVATTITNSTKPGAELDWEKPVNQISVSDTYGGYRLVAKVKKSDGTVIYSDSADSKITFAFAENYSPTALFLSNGSISPFTTGSDYVLVKYGEDVIGSTTIAVGTARVPASVVTLIDGVVGANVTMSDAYNVTNPQLSIAVYDNYGAIYPITSAAEITITAASSTAPGAYVLSVNSDGTASISMSVYSRGSQNGNGYSYSIKYKSGTTELATAFAVLVYSPNALLTSNYRAVISGKTDMIVKTADDLTGKIKISLVEYKGNVQYSNRTLKDKNSCSVGEYYIVIKYSDGTEITPVISEGAAVLNTVSLVSTSISKMKTGAYSYIIYQKTAGTNDTLVPGGSGSFTLTDSQEGASFVQKSTTTTVALKSTSSQSEKDSAFNQCFTVAIGGTTAIGTVTDAIMADGGMYVRSVTVSGTITIGANTYSISYPLNINAAITSTK